ncbi:MAG: lytic transglycosylase domain-containing protein [Sphingopyxis sp.]
MASMVSRYPLPHIALAALLLTPAMCMATELTPEQRAWYQAQLGIAATGASAAPNPTGEAVIEWQALDRATNPSFDRVASFLMANPGWPNEGELKRKAEAALDVNGFVPAHAAAYFARFAPTNAAGQLRYALALLADGRRDEANAAARRAWTMGALSAPEEARLLSVFPGALSGGDQDARMERLLWSASASDAARQISFVSSSRRPEFEARLAMRARAPAAALRAAEVEGADPSLLRANAGYIFDKARWLALSGQTQAARALLASPRTLTAPPLDADNWLELLLAQARASARDGQHALAYDIARQVDDLFPAGTVIIDQPLPVRDKYTSLVWLGAQTAFQQLGRTREAAALYVLYAAGGRSPQVRARGLYWAGRAMSQTGDQTAANAYFTRAAQHYDQFHGQLALERLGLAQPRPIADATVRFSAAERDAFNANSVVRAIRVLGEIGARRDQTLFLRTIANNARSDVDHYFAGRLSDEIGRPDLGVMIGRSARINGLADSYVPTAFPTVRLPVGYDEDWTFIHAISRQESQFDRAAMSRAGARGLMQLMPGTARETSSRMGLNYNLEALTSDSNYNIMLGSTYFRRMLSYYAGSYPLAVAAYNAGPGNVNRWLAANGDPRSGSVDMLTWIEAIPLNETRNYVQRVLENAVVYDTLRPGAPDGQHNMLSHYLGKSTPG